MVSANQEYVRHTILLISLLVLIASPGFAHGQTFNVVNNFTGSSGAYPYSLAILPDRKRRPSAPDSNW